MARQENQDVTWHALSILRLRVIQLHGLKKRSKLLRVELLSFSRVWWSSQSFPELRSSSLAVDLSWRQWERCGHQAKIDTIFSGSLLTSHYVRGQFPLDLCSSFSSHDGTVPQLTLSLIPTTRRCCNVPYPLLLFISVPGAVSHINATVLSDTSLHILWTESPRPNGPKESVRYQLLMSHRAPIPETPLRQGDFPNARLALLVTKLSGGQLYVLKVLRDWVSWELLVATVTHMFWKG